MAKPTTAPQNPKIRSAITDLQAKIAAAAKAAKELTILQTDAEKLAFQQNQNNDLTMICMAVMRNLGMDGPIRNMPEQSAAIAAELESLRENA